MSEIGNVEERDLSDGAVSLLHCALRNGENPDQQNICVIPNIVYWVGFFRRNLLLYVELVFWACKGYYTKHSLLLQVTYMPKDCSLCPRKVLFSTLVTVAN